jgi:hypothetical protein
LHRGHRDGRGLYVSGAKPPRWSSLYEAIADSPDGGDLLADRAELFAEAHDVGVDRPVEPFVIVAPESLGEEVAAEGPAGVRGEEDQELVII